MENSACGWNYIFSRFRCTKCTEYRAIKAIQIFSSKVKLGNKTVTYLTDTTWDDIWGRFS